MFARRGQRLLGWICDADRGASPGSKRSIYVLCRYKWEKLHWSPSNDFKPFEQLICRSSHCWSRTGWTFFRRTIVCKSAATDDIAPGMRGRTQNIFWYFSPNFFFVLISPACADAIRHRWLRGSPRCLACGLGSPQWLSKKIKHSSLHYIIPFRACSLKSPPPPYFRELMPDLNSSASLVIFTSWTPSSALRSLRSLIGGGLIYPKMTKYLES